MSDIVERLRTHPYHNNIEIRHEAADEIERLQLLIHPFEGAMAKVEEQGAEIERLKAAFDFVRRGVVTYSVVELDEHFRNARDALEGK